MSNIQPYIILNGTEGRLELVKYAAHGDKFSLVNGEKSLKLYNRKGEAIELELPEEKTTGHGGADDALRDNLFRGIREEDKGKMADTTAGLMSIGIGMAANISMAEKRRVYLKEFYKDLKKY